MKRIGFVYLPKTKNKQVGPRCMNCGNTASKRVTYANEWTKLIVNLCGKCAYKEYSELTFNHQQSLFAGKSNNT